MDIKRNAWTQQPEEEVKIPENNKDIRKEYNQITRNIKKMSKMQGYMAGRPMC